MGNEEIGKHPENSSDLARFFTLEIPEMIGCLDRYWRLNVECGSGLGFIMYDTTDFTFTFPPKGYDKAAISDGDGCVRNNETVGQ